MRRVALWLTISGSLLFAPQASAAPPQDVEAAQKLFDEALQLMETKRYAEACPKLEQSQRLDPGMGTLYRLADCFDLSGLTGTAWKLYREVATDAKIAGRADRQQQAEDRARALEPKLPWLVIEVPPAVAALKGLVVKCDDSVIEPSELGKRRVVDPGAHTVTVTAEGHSLFSQTIRSLEGSTLRLPIPALRKPSEPPPVESGLRGQHTAAIATGSFGVAAVGVGVGLGLLASSAWDDALAGCDGGATNRCSDDAIAGGKRANLFAVVSTVGFVVGGAAVVAAPIIWFTAPGDTPSAAIAIAPSIGPRQATLTLLGRF